MSTMRKDENISPRTTGILVYVLPASRARFGVAAGMVN
jgi:hypothetical protein